MRKQPKTLSQACKPPSGGSASGSMGADLVERYDLCVRREAIRSSSSDGVLSSSMAASLKHDGAFSLHPFPMSLSFAGVMAGTPSGLDAAVVACTSIFATVKQTKMTGFFQALVRSSLRSPTNHWLTIRDRDSPTDVQRKLSVRGPKCKKA